MKYYLILFAFLAFACNKSAEPPKPDQMEELIEDYKLISTKWVDSCKYVVSPIRGKSHGLNLVHAGDCSYTKHWVWLCKEKHNATK